MKYMLMAQLLVLSFLAFAGDKPASCELESKNIVSRSPSGVAQVSNLGDIQVTCSVAARAFPTKPGEVRYGLRAATTAYKISPDGSQTVVPSEVHQSGGGSGTNPAGLVGTNPELEWVVFDVHIPLDAAERDREFLRYLAKMEKLLAPQQITKEDRQRALERAGDVVYQHRVGHFHLEWRISDGDRVIGVGVVELEVLFKGRFSDAGLPASPPV
jgi:hypothetical protein